MTPIVSNTQLNNYLYGPNGGSSNGALPVGNSDSGAAATFERSSQTATPERARLTSKGQRAKQRLVKEVAAKYNISEEQATKLVERMQLKQVIEAFNTNDEGHHRAVRKKIEVSIENAISRNGIKAITDDNIELVANNAARYTIGALQNKTADEVDALRAQHSSAASLLEEYIPDELKGKTLSEMTPEEVKTVVEKYLEKVNLKEDLEKIKNATGEEQAQLIEALKTRQLEAFYKLAIVANDDDIKIFGATMKCVIQEAMPEMIDAIRAIFPEKAQKTALANDMSTDFSMRYRDITGRTLSCEVAQKTSAYITQNVDEEHAKSYSETLNKDIQFAQGVEKKALEITGKEKLSDLTPEEIKALLENPDFSDEEKSFLVDVMLNGTLKGFESGSMAGFADNQVISTDLQQQILEEIHTNASQLSNYEEVLAAVKTYLEENSHEFSDITKIEEVLNKVTDGKYQEVADTVDLNAGKSESKGNAQSDDGLGFNNPKQQPASTQNQTNPIKFKEESSEPEFVVESNRQPQGQTAGVTKAGLLAGVTSYDDIMNCLRAGFTQHNIITHFLSNIKDATEPVKRYLTERLSNDSTADIYSDRAMNSTEVARLYIKAGTGDKIDKEHAISYVREMLERNEDQNQESYVQLT